MILLYTLGYEADQGWLHAPSRPLRVFQMPCVVQSREKRSGRNLRFRCLRTDLRGSKGTLRRRASKRRSLASNSLREKTKRGARPSPCPSFFIEEGGLPVAAPLSLALAWGSRPGYAARARALVRSRWLEGAWAAVRPAPCSTALDGRGHGAGLVRGSSPKAPADADSTICPDRSRGTARRPSPARLRDARRSCRS